MEDKNIKDAEQSGAEISCGAYLKQVREQKNITLEKANQDLKIVKHLLEAIEQDNYKILPPPAYLRGIIRRYACYLRLDEEKILDFYQKSNGRKISSGDKDIFPQNRFSVSRPAPTHFFSQLLSRILQCLFIIIIAGYFLFELTKFVLPAKIVLYYPPKDLTTNNSHLEISGKVARAEILYFQNREISFDNQGVFKESIILTPGVNLLELKAVNALGRETILEQNIVLSEY